MTPTHGLQRVKRYLRRYCRKPADMTVREFWANFQRINNEEIPNMPPLYDATQSLKRDELIDILLYSLPKSWQGEMNKQNYDPFGGSVQDLIDFAERMETAEALDAKASGRKQESSAKEVVGQEEIFVVELQRQGWKALLSFAWRRRPYYR